MWSGLRGEVDYVDDTGLIHVKWENGSGLALVYGVDRFHKTDVTQKEKQKADKAR